MTCKSAYARPKSGTNKPNNLAGDNQYKKMCPCKRTLAQMVEPQNMFRYYQFLWLTLAYFECLPFGDTIGALN